MTIAARLDANDELAGFAGKFVKPPGVYMDGNSLGLMCRAAHASLQDAVKAWETLGVRGWTEGGEPWFGLSRKVAARLAPLLGCDPDDVTVGNSTTVNLHQLLTTFCDPRRGVLLDGTHFPTDRYAVDSFIRSHGIARNCIALIEPGPDRLLDEDMIVRCLQNVGFAVLPSVVFTTGQLLDLNRVTACRDRGVLIAWDCSHSVGVVPHRFRDDGIDLAFGCGYKHLNGGPGAAAWMYVHPRLQDRLPGMAGWFGSDPAKQFEMSAEFHPAANAERFQIGTPHVFSLAPLLGSLGVIHAAGIDRIREKSIRQTQFLMEKARERLQRYGVGIVTPHEAKRRGGHVTLAHGDAADLSRALRMRGVVPDFRPPDLLRFAPAPLYTSFAECESAIESLESVLSEGAHHTLAGSHELVT